MTSVDLSVPSSERCYQCLTSCPGPHRPDRQLRDIIDLTDVQIFPKSLLDTHKTLALSDSFIFSRPY